MNSSPSALLNEITRLSHEFGTPDYVQGGGGNTSAKDAGTLWIKPSGTSLSGLTPERFVALDRAILRRMFTTGFPREAQAREAAVKTAMEASVRAGQTGRPSVESPLHDLLPATFVVHTHATLVNGMTCARNGRDTCLRLFPDALWVPYIDPGYTLCMDARQRLAGYQERHGRAADLIFLENHGLFVSGDSAEGIRAIYQRVIGALRAEYAAAGVATRLPATSGTPADQAGEERRIRELLGAEAAGVAVSDPFAAASGPITPDHIVYSKSYPFTGPLTAEALGAFRSRHGYAPRVIVTASGVYGVGSSPTVARLALDLARDGALVAQLAAAFGGVQFLSDPAREFIEQWEVESYRARQMGG